MSGRRTAHRFTVTIPITAVVLTACATGTVAAAPLDVDRTRPGRTTTVVWVNEGWSPGHRLCEMDAHEIAYGRPWRCVRPPGGVGWDLLIGNRW